VTVEVFAPLKAVYRNKADKLFQRDANTVGKQHFISLYSFARDKAFTKRNITTVMECLTDAGTARRKNRSNVKWLQ